MIVLTQEMDIGKHIGKHHDGDMMIAVFIMCLPSLVNTCLAVFR